MTLECIEGKNATKETIKSTGNTGIVTLIKQKYYTNVVFTKVDNYAEVMEETIPILNNYKQHYLE